MVKELAPKPANALLVCCLMPSIAVKMPTSAIMPIAIISAVSDVRNLFPLIEVKAMIMFSL